jgi:death on curing protein
VKEKRFIVVLLTPKFPDLSTVLRIHDRQIEKFSGTSGLRDRGLLESALAQPQASFGEEFLHPDLPQQAAAYLYHIALNHPFVDGNKRTAFAVAVTETFLRLNGCGLSLSDEQTYQLVIEVVEGRISKKELSRCLEQAVIRRDG